MRQMKYLNTGPGGRKCACCFAPPGSKARRKEFRAAKVRERRDAWKLETQTET